MRQILFFAVVLALVAGAGVWFALDRNAAPEPPRTISSQPTATPEQATATPSPERISIEDIQRAFDRDVALGRFAGRLGDFQVYTKFRDVPDEAQILYCSDGGPRSAVTDAGVLKRHELWSDLFGSIGIGWECDDGEIVLLNTGKESLPEMEGGGFSKMYFWQLPVPVVMEAPLDRIELIEIDGHVAIIEHPMEVYPYAQANLVVIERYPTGDLPGIVAFVHFAPSSEVAIAIAQALVR